MSTLAEILRVRLADYKARLWHRPSTLIPQAEAETRAWAFFTRPLFRLFR